MIKAIHTQDAPAAIGPYSQAVQAGDYVFISGQIPADPYSGEIVSNDVTEQARQVFRNLAAILDAAGGSMEQVVKATVFMKDMNDFQAVNAIYAEFMSGKVLPARAAVEVARLPRDIKVEVEAIAYLG